MAKKAKKAKSKTKKRKSGKKAAPARKKKRVVAKKSLTPRRPRGRPWAAHPGAAAARAAGPPRNLPRDQSTGLTIVPVGSFSSREREPIASAAGSAIR